MLPLRFIDRVKFFVERQFVRGASFQLLVVAALIGLISLAGGLLVYPFDAKDLDFGDAVWWAFLRLTDPGYLGDDVGTWRRIISTILTISGYVVFLGALVAIMTRWLIARMNQLEKGLTPVAYKNHVVILGWNNRTLPLLRELLGSTKRMRRSLLGSSRNRLNLVVLAEEMSAIQAQALRDEPGIGASRAKNIVLRSGSPLETEALQRSACLNAAVVIIPSSGQEFNSLVSSDVETIKALLSLDAQARKMGTKPPFVVAEIQDLRKLRIIQRAYSGPLQVVAGDATISSLIAQNILHPGLSEVYNELLTDQNGNEFFLRSGANFQGQSLSALSQLCPRAIICGVLSKQDVNWRIHLNAPSDLVIQAEDKILMIAGTYADTEPNRIAGHRRQEIARRRMPQVKSLSVTQKRRLLILGWNHKVPALIYELASYRHQYQFEVDIVSIVPIAERELFIGRYHENNARIKCTHTESDYMFEGALREINPGSYDSIVLLSSDRMASGEEADARAIVGYAILDEMLQNTAKRPQILLELADPDNEALITHKDSETIISPMVLSHVLAQVALRPELRMVFDELFTVGGAEITFREPSVYKLQPPLPFWKLETLVAEAGETVLGVYRHKADAEGRHLLLNPGRDVALDLLAGDQIVVLTLTGITKETAQL